MNIPWEPWLGILYLLVLLYTVVRIILDTPSTSKTLAYLLLIFILPVAGILFYYFFGIRYRHQRTVNRWKTALTEFDRDFFEKQADPTDHWLKTFSDEIGHFGELVLFLHRIGGEYLSEGSFQLLVNGEEKFPLVLEDMRKARQSIHLEYYAWENDTRGNQIKEVLLKKAAAGVTVRVLYDDYASRGIKSNIVRELKAGGVKVFPKIKVRIYQLANRLNHRDHRKVIVIDGQVGYVGGINISDRYDNSIDTGLYWRDTHLRFTGPLVHGLSRHFLSSWNSAAPNHPLPYAADLFPQNGTWPPADIPAIGQMVAGGPIYPNHNIMMSYLRIFSLARDTLWITNPYFIPNASVFDGLRQAALSGVDVRMILPDKSDAMLVGEASRFYFEELLRVGIRIFLYRKGFVHAKTVVADGRLSVVGTANLDNRSFDLNFELMSVVYSRPLARQMEQMFRADQENCREISYEEWSQLGLGKRLAYGSARLISSFL